MTLRGNTSIEFIAFTCQYCSEHQEWDTPRAADAAALWHLYEAHPLVWLALVGDRPPTEPQPQHVGRGLVLT